MSYVLLIDPNSNKSLYGLILIVKKCTNMLKSGTDLKMFALVQSHNMGTNGEFSVK